MTGFSVTSVLAIARAEARLSRRLVRYWVFLSLALLLGLAGYLYYAFLHGFFSSYSATVSSIGPRWLIGAVGQNYLLLMMIGLVFLGFDLRARDRRERMLEVLDCRPFSNLELVFGRFLGLMAMAWIPVVGLALVVELLGVLLPALGAPLGELVEPWSLIGFVFAMAPPAFTFTIAVVFLVVLVVRHRLVAAVVSLAILAGLFIVMLRVPMTWAPLLDITGGYVMDFPSDLVPRVVAAGGWLQRLGVLAASLGILVVAAAVHPRADGGSPTRRLGGGLAAVLAGVALMGFASWSRMADVAQMESWRAAHVARAGEPLVDIRSIEGSVDIEPGRRMALELELEVAAPAETDLRSLLFSFNPGLAVASVEDGGGESLQFEYENGLLEVEHALPAGESLHLRVVAAGRPDVRFGYLDAVKQSATTTPMQGQLLLLGYERAIFDPAFVALLPGVRWLPMAGADVGSSDPRTRPRDFFDVDLEIGLPPRWLAAGPGRRQEQGDGRFRFDPGAPIDGAALVAGRFESAQLEVDGVELEMLISPKHAKSLEVLAPAKDAIEQRLREHLDAAASSGLPYPYDGFTLVEVPNRLRTFGGGWRLDTVFAPASMVMMRESGFPTARFDLAFRNPEDFADREGGLPVAMRERVERFFLNDFSGGSLQGGASRSFFHHFTAPRGPEAVGLEFALDELTSLVVTDHRTYFSAHLFGPELNQAVGQVMQSYFSSPNRDADFASAVIDAFTSRPEVWEAVLSSSLADLDTESDPKRAFDALTLKAGALAQSLVDQLGRDAVGRLLGELRGRHEGGTFDLEAFMTALQEIDPASVPLVEEWLTSTALPGFVADQAKVYRLPDGEGGSARYQLELEVRNDEPVPGVLRITTVLGQGDERQTLESDPIRIPGHSSVEWGKVLSRPPEQLRIEPYLSLNREAFRVPFDEVDETRIVEAEPFDGIKEVPWSGAAGDAIIVDDLDDGFRVEVGDERDGLRLGSRGGNDDELDRGLPRARFGRPSSAWSRTDATTAWGRYRHTEVLRTPGEGQHPAVFSAEIPSAATWELAIHLPQKGRSRRTSDWGTWKLVVVNSNGDQIFDFDAGSAGQGWHVLGQMELAAGTAEVRLSDATDGDVIIADAIRWTPVRRDGPVERTDGEAR